jgi:hypothetical protein
MERVMSKVYAITYDGITDVVEADNFGDSIQRWYAYNRIHNDLDFDAEPDSVVFINCENFIRKGDGE